MFEKILGHEQNKKYFSNRSTFSHAYIFVGDRGVGKFTFANEIAESISGLNRNIHIVKPEKSSISVDQIRQLQQDIAMPPFNGNANKRVVIVDDADSMNETSQNALLKTLEEPPNYVILFLIVKDMNKLLTTIKSRATIFKFFRLKDNEIEDLLSESSIDKKLKPFLMVYVNGSIGKAKSLIETPEKLNEISELYVLSNKLEVFNIDKNKKFVADFMDFFKGDKSRIPYIQTIVDYYIKLFYNTNEPKYLELSNLISDKYNQIQRGANPNISLISMLLGISHINKI